MRNKERTLQIDRQVPEIIKLYSQGLGIMEVAAKTGIPRDCIRTRLKKLGLVRSTAPNRKQLNSLRLNNQYFQTIDTPEKAYWLGILTADGTVSKDGYKVSLTSKDAELVEKFRTAIESKHKVSVINQSDKRTGKV